jgi:predicted N-acyltransferase
LIRGELDAPRRAAVLARLVAAARELAAREGARLRVFGYLPASQVRELIAADGRLAPVFAMSELAIEDITGFDAYLERLNSHRKNAIRRELRRFTEHGLRIEQRRLADVVDEVSQVVARHEAKFDPSVTYADMRAAFDDWIAHGYSDISRVFCAFHGSALVAAAIYVVHDATYYARDAAVVPDVPKQAAVYFNLSFYHAIGAAAAEGVRRIHYGIETFAAKVEKGAVPTPLWFAFDPGDWDPGALAAMRAAASARLLAEAAELRRYRPDDVVERQLELAWSLRALGHAP